MNVYETAHSNAVWRDLSHFGRFSVSGADAAHLLHHLTTNDIKGLKVGQGCDTVLVNNKARILDLLSIFRRDNDFLIVTSPNRRAMFASHAQKFVLYRQDVKIVDITDSGGMLGVFGTNAHRVLDAIGLGDLESETNQIQRTVNGLEVSLVHTTRLPLKSYFLWSENREALLQLLQNSATQCDNETYNVLRIEAGLPVTGLELTEEYNPWEAGLKNAISLHKGCYNGQEIIARLNTYQKIKQHLRGVRLQQLVKELPVKLTYEGREVGVLTSNAVSPRFGAIGLAYVRNDYIQTGQELQASDGESSQNVTVCDVPFDSL
jgi:folate-binding protein YgfZ